MAAAKVHACKDCRALPVGDQPKTPRPAPHQGPRCATHHRAAVKARRARAHENHVKRVFGLSDGEYARLLAAQGGVCFLCRRAKGLNKKLPVDHDHKTGRIRGLLCNPCNQMLGHGRDDVDFFRRVIAYLLNPPASWVGLDKVVPSQREETVPAFELPGPGRLQPWPFANDTAAGRILNGEENG